MVNSDEYLRIGIPSFSLVKLIEIIEVLLFGIVLALIPITLAGVFVTTNLK